MLKSYLLSVPFVSAVLVACAADPGTRPHDMSTAQHEAAAKQEERSASEHSAQHDPAATVARQRCAKPNVCWTSRSNPTERHRRDAARHQELAEKHRAAGAALAQAESQSCSGIEPEDRDVSPFYRREDIASARPLEKEVRTGKTVTKKLSGVIVVFRAVPGLTAEWFQRQVDCHIARAAALGHQMPEMQYCPLVLKGVKATVSSVGDGFAVAIEADDSETAKEVLKRAEAAASSSGSNQPAASLTQ